MHRPTVLSLVAAIALFAGATICVSPTARADDVVYRIVNKHSGQCLEVFSSSTANGATVDQWTCNHTATQQWFLVDHGLGDYGDSISLVNANSGKCLEVYYSSLANGAKVDQWTCNGTATQTWLKGYGSDGYYGLTNLNSWKVLEVFSSSTAKGAKVDQWTSNNTATQRWSIVRD